MTEEVMQPQQGMARTGNVKLRLEFMGLGTARSFKYAKYTSYKVHLGIPQILYDPTIFAALLH